VRPRPPHAAASRSATRPTDRSAYSTPPHYYARRPHQRDYRERGLLPCFVRYIIARPAVVSLATPWLHRHEAATSVLVCGEVTEYLKGLSGPAQRQSELRTLFGEIYPYDLTYRILERYAELRRQMRAPHGTGLIGDVDTLIAATALERNLTVVTMDQDFQRVPSLKVMLLPRR
jgi:predicted nucleic acid-binding protein